MSTFNNISYRGYLDSRSNRVHSHFLKVKSFEYINKLQKVPYSINTEMLSFIDKNQEALSGSNTLLLLNRGHDHHNYPEVVAKWANVYSSERVTRATVWR